jgi:uncharacterized membrane protein
MKEKLDYIYYRFYRFQVSVGNGAIAGPFTVMFLCFLLTVNFFSLANLLYGITGIAVQFENEIILGLIIPCIFGVAGYFLFIQGKRYKQIVKKYEKELKQQRKKGNLLVIGYFVLSILFLGFSFYLMIQRNGG